MAIEIKYGQAAEISSQSLAAAMATNRNKIIALLKKHGIAVDQSYKDQAIILAVLMAMRDQKMGTAFTNDLKGILVNNKPVLNFTAESETFFRNVTGDTGSSQKSTIGSLVSDPNTWSSILNTGLDVLSSSVKSKSDKQLADTALKIEQEKTKQAELIAAQKAGGGNGSTSSGMSTGAKIAIGVGVAVVIITIVVLVFRKKK